MVEIPWVVVNYLFTCMIRAVTIPKQSPARTSHQWWRQSVTLLYDETTLKHTNKEVAKYFQTAMTFLFIRYSYMRGTLSFSSWRVLKMATYNCVERWKCRQLCVSRGKRLHGVDGRFVQTVAGIVDAFVLHFGIIQKPERVKKRLIFKYSICNSWQWTCSRKRPRNASNRAYTSRGNAACHTKLWLLDDQEKNSQNLSPGFWDNHFGDLVKKYGPQESHKVVRVSSLGGFPGILRTRSKLFGYVKLQTNNLLYSMASSTLDSLDSNLP